MPGEEEQSRDEEVEGASILALWVWIGNSLGSFFTVCGLRIPEALGKPKV